MLPAAAALGIIVMTLVAILLIVGGFALTALSMRKHHLQVFQTEPARRAAIAWRALGWTCLGLALVPCISHYGVAIAIVAWTGFLTVGALLVTLLLTYRPRVVSWVAFATPAVAAVLFVLEHVRS